MDPLLNGFVRIGGAALALCIGRRVSDDLDVAYLGDLLPGQSLRQPSRTFTNRGIHFALNQHVSAEQDFIDSGLLPDDHQQDYLANDAIRVCFANPVHGSEILDQRLRACVPGKADQGYLHLVEPAPSPEELRLFFNASLDQPEIDLGKAAFRCAAGPSTHGLQGEPSPGYPALFFLLPRNRG